MTVDLREGDVEALPSADGTFDVVLSQFGHMFAPRPEVAIAEMLRMLRPGGTIAFSTWPPEQLLRAMGHEVEMAHDGPTALTLLDRFVPDAALLDIGLP